jgi:hypothetical protein
MTFTKYLKYLLLAVITFTTSYYSFGGGFPVRPGRLIISPSVSYFFADKEWDSTGVKKSFANNGKFNSLSLNIYAEYGISRRFAAVAILPYTYNDYSAGGKSTISSGLTDMETGIKYYLANISYIYYISLQATAITPLYNNNRLGYDEEGAEFRVAFAGSGFLFDRSYYFNLEDGIRQYFGTGGPWQDRYTGTFGLTLDRQFENQVSVSLGGYYTYSSDKNFNIYNPTISKNFAFKQVSLSYGHSFTHEISAFITAGQFITGRNTGDGSSASVTLVYRLLN